MVVAGLLELSLLAVYFKAFASLIIAVSHCILAGENIYLL